MGQVTQLSNRNRGEFQESRFGGARRADSTGLRSMQCSYCHAWNEDDVRRCVRCGRRVAPRAGQGPFPYMTALAESWNLNQQADQNQQVDQRQTDNQQSGPQTGSKSQ
jgi:hypothetical protein